MSHKVSNDCFLFMSSYSNLINVSRCRPLLGTFVEIKGSHADETRACEAVQAAFDAVSRVEREMSFHAPDSELSLLNAYGHLAPIHVSHNLYSVLKFSQNLFKVSGGVFDVSIGSELVDYGELPQHLPHRGTGTGQDITLLEGGRVHYHVPLVVDLGGIAKGFAVDQAIEVLEGFGLNSGLVNAGGDLRYFGYKDPDIWVRLAPHQYHQGPLPYDPKKKALATSNLSQKREGLAGCLHLDGLSRKPVSDTLSVSVLSETCMVADALTKIVTVLQDGSHSILKQFNAIAFMTRL